VTLDWNREWRAAASATPGGPGRYDDYVPEDDLEADPEEEDR
jgi:hypothetical protein